MDRLILVGDLTGAQAQTAKRPLMPQRQKEQMKSTTRAPKAAKSPTTTTPPSAPALTPTPATPTPPTPGPLTVCDSKGRVYRSDKPTRVRCLADIATQVEEVVTTTLALNKTDVTEFTGIYLNNRFVNTGRENEIARRFNASEFEKKWPTISLNEKGVGNNGMHTSKGFIKSNLLSWEFVILLGTAKEMGTLIDTGKPRSPADQGSYIDTPVYANIKAQGERQNFVAATSYIFALAAGRQLWNIALTESQAKSKLCQHPTGQKLLKACNPHFVHINEVLKQLAADDSAYSLERYQRVIGYVPALILCLTGRKDWVEPFFSGSKRGKGELLQTANRLLDNLSPTRGEPSRREAGEVRHMVYDLLNPLHAKATNAPYSPFLPRFEVVKNGNESRSVKIDYTDTKKHKPDELKKNIAALSRDQRKRREIASYFLGQIEGVC